MNANPRYANGHRRRALVRRVRHEEDMCWLCGHPVDKALPPALPGSPEVHEVIPVSRGGDPLDRGNCHLTHRYCNQQQGNRLPDEPPNPRPRPAWLPPIETTRTW